VDTKTAKQDGEDPGDEFLIRSHGFPVLHCSHVDSLHGLVAGADWCRKRSLAVRAILRYLIIDGAALGAVSAHLYTVSELGLRVCEDTQATNNESENQVAAPKEDPKTEKDVTEKFSFLRRIQCARHVA